MHHKTKIERLAHSPHCKAARIVIDSPQQKQKLRVMKPLSRALSLSLYVTYKSGKTLNSLSSITATTAISIFTHYNVLSLLL